MSVGFWATKPLSATRPFASLSGSHSYISLISVYNKVDNFKVPSQRLLRLNPTESNRIRQNPTESDQIWPNLPRIKIRPRPSKSDRIRQNPTLFTKDQNLTKSYQVRPSPTMSYRIRPNPTKSDEIWRNPTNPTKSDRIYQKIKIRWNPTESDQIRRNSTNSDGIRQNPTKSDWILDVGYFCLNPIPSIYFFRILSQNRLKNSQNKWLNEYKPTLTSARTILPPRRFW